MSDQEILRTALEQIERVALARQDHQLKKIVRLGRIAAARIAAEPLQQDTSTPLASDVLGPRVLGRIRNELIATKQIATGDWEGLSAKDLFLLCDELLDFPGVARKQMEALRDAAKGS